MYIIICLLTKNAKIYIIEKKKIGKKKKKKYVEKFELLFRAKTRIARAVYSIFSFFGAISGNDRKFRAKVDARICPFLPEILVFSGNVLVPVPVWYP